MREGRKDVYAVNEGEGIGKETHNRDYSAERAVQRRRTSNEGIYRRKLMNQ
jgi:hypothetical protein